MERITKSSTLEKVHEWLTSNNINFDVDAKREHLVTLAMEHQGPDRYIMDELLKRKEIVALRLPPYHCHFNAIELIWGIAKARYSKQNGINHKYSHDDVLRVWYEVLDTIDGTVWNNVVQHTDSIIQKAYAEECIKDITDYSQFRFNLAEDSDSDNNEEAVDDPLPLTDVLVQLTPEVLHRFGDGHRDVENQEFEGIMPLQDFSPLPVELESTNQHTHVDQCHVNNSKASLDFNKVDVLRVETESLPAPSVSGYVAARTVTLVSLSSDMLAVAEQAINVPENTVVVDKFKICLKGSDMRCLKVGLELVDTVINMYLELVQERSIGTAVSVHAMNTFFYGRFLQGGYPAVQKWTQSKRKKILIFEKQIVFFPIHSNHHWTLVSLSTASAALSYYDSLGGDGLKIINDLLGYLQLEWEHTYNGVDCPKWHQQMTETIPQQNNHVDCGIYLCAFVEHLSRKSPLTFVAEDVNHLRHVIAYEISTLTLLNKVEKISKCRKKNPPMTIESWKPDDFPHRPSLEVPILHPVPSNTPSSVKNHLHEPPSKMKMVQIRDMRTAIDHGVVLRQSSSFHMNHSKIPQEHRGQQGLAIPLFAVLYMHLKDGCLTKKDMDDVVMDGDKYFGICKEANVDLSPRLSFYHLPSVDILHRNLKVKVAEFGCGWLSSNNRGAEVLSCLENCDAVGFIFEGFSKVVAISIIENSFFLFTPRPVDINNRYMCVASKGKARLFRCLSAPALMALLFVEHPREKEKWTLYKVECT